MHGHSFSARSTQQHRPHRAAQQLPVTGSVNRCNSQAIFCAAELHWSTFSKSKSFLSKKQSLSCDPAELYCLHRNIHSNLWIATGFHLCLGQVIYKHKDNNNKVLPFLRLLVARRGVTSGSSLSLVPAIRNGCRDTSQGICFIHKRNRDTPQYSSSPVFQLSKSNLPPVWGKWETVERGTSGHPTPPPLLCSFLPFPSTNPPPVLSHSLHSSHRPQILPLKC